jgi:hypothetical protein
MYVEVDATGLMDQGEFFVRFNLDIVKLFDVLFLPNVGIIEHLMVGWHLDLFVFEGSGATTMTCVFDTQPPPVHLR